MRKILIALAAAAALIIPLVAYNGLAVPERTAADHAFLPPPGLACKTVVVAFWYSAFIDPPNILVYALDTSDMNMLQDVTELPLTPTGPTGAAGSTGVERISFKHEPYVWITEVDFDSIEAHSAAAFFQDCKSG